MWSPSLSFPLLLVLSALTQSTEAFLHSTQIRSDKTALNYCDDLPPVVLPSVKQVSEDSFTEQTYHASSIINEFVAASSILLTEDDHKSQIELQELLIAQLSHQDGIRGFFAAYLTGEGTTPADGDRLPVPLSQAMKRVDMSKVAPLACMNVIRPTAMASIHTDPTLAANSAKTAERAKNILSKYKGSINVVRNCEAIFAVATGTTEAVEARLAQFWQNVFEESNYKAAEKEAIAKAFSEFV